MKKHIYLIGVAIFLIVLYFIHDFKPKENNYMYNNIAQTIYNSTSKIYDTSEYKLVIFKLDSLVKNNFITDTILLTKITYFLAHKSVYYDNLKKYQNLSEHDADILKTYGREMYDKLKAHKIWLGMSDNLARISWGEPEKINRSIGSWGVHEQWIYDDTNLYFEDGKLTSWQD